MSLGSVGTCSRHACISELFVGVVTEMAMSLNLLGLCFFLLSIVNVHNCREHCHLKGHVPKTLWDMPFSCLLSCRHFGSSHRRRINQALFFPPAHFFFEIHLINRYLGLRCSLNGYRLCQPVRRITQSPELPFDKIRKGCTRVCLAIVCLRTGRWFHQVTFRWLF